MSDFTKTHSDYSSLNYSEQFVLKNDLFNADISAFYSGPIHRFESPESGYRMRAEFRVWHEGNEIHYAMFKPGSKTLYHVEKFAPAHQHIQQLMPRLLLLLKSNQELRHRLFSAEFLCTQAGETLITLIYHRPLDDDWDTAAQALQAELKSTIIGRSRKQKRVLTLDYVTEIFNVEGHPYQYRQYEGAFSQPNAAINQKMLDWANSEAKRLGGDYLELYCGNGNFTLPLSKHFGKVLTTEVSKTSIAALKWSIEENRLTNIDHARLSAEELSQALSGIRPFRRLSHLDLGTYHFSTILVDPPRAGIDETTLAFMSDFENIIYISCNPTTLVSNLRALSQTHNVVSAATFDQFPFTPHLEAGVCLQRNR